MKHLLILNLLLTAAAVTMATVLGVVCLLYWFNLDAAPRMARELPGIARLAAVFVPPALFCMLASWAVHRRHAVWWLAQGLFVAGLVFASIYVWEFAQS